MGKGGSCLGSPESESGDVLGTDVDGGVETVIVAVVPDADPVAVAIGAAGDDAVTIFGEARDREVGVNASDRIEKIRVDNPAGRRVASDAGDGEGFQEPLGIGALDIENGEMRGPRSTTRFRWIRL